MYKYQIGVFRSQKEGFSAFIPHAFPPKGMVFSNRILKKHSHAMRLIGKLDGVASLLPEKDYFLEMFVRKDAVSSSQIEGTQASMIDAIGALNVERDSKLPDDVDDILHYIDALNYGLDRAQTFPFTLRYIRELHEKLMKHARTTHNPYPGEFRTRQNWIGGTMPSTAKFVPPPVHNMHESLNDFENFIHADDDIPELIKAAMLHAQFETIHPFVDGNGRTGRLLITMYLWHERMLETPVLYLSSYFKRHKAIYYDMLNQYRSPDGDIEPWLDFFLDGVIETAQSAIDTCQKITEIREVDMRKIQQFGKLSAESGMVVLRNLYRIPIVGIADIIKWTGYSKPGAYKVIERLIEAGIIEPVGQEEYGQKYSYRRYVDSFETDSGL